MTTATLAYLGLIPALALVGCVTVPAGPTVMVLPGRARAFEAFQADNFACQQFAQSSLGLNAPQGQLVADPAGGGAAVADAHRVRPRARRSAQ